jgi:hypothetical protein
MPGAWDATVKDVRAVNAGTDNTLDVIKSGDAFDIVAEVEVGEGILSFGGSYYRLTVTVRNQSQLTVYPSIVVPRTDLPASKVKFNQAVRVSFPGGWVAAEDDVLDVSVSFSLKTGVYTDTTAAVGRTFIVSDE